MGAVRCRERLGGLLKYYIREGSSIKVDGTADHGLPISTYEGCRGTSLAKDLPGLIYHQRAQSNDFWLMAPTRTSSLTKRGQGYRTRGPRQGRKRGIHL